MPRPLPASTSFPEVIREHVGVSNGATAELVDSLVAFNSRLATLIERNVESEFLRQRLGRQIHERLLTLAGLVAIEIR